MGAMVFLQVNRVSEGLVAVAALEDQHCAEMEGCLADGLAAQDLSLWIWPRSTTGK